MHIFIYFGHPFTMSIILSQPCLGNKCHVYNQNNFIFSDIRMLCIRKCRQDCSIRQFFRYCAHPITMQSFAPLSIFQLFFYFYFIIMCALFETIICDTCKNATNTVISGKLLLCTGAFTKLISICKPT